MAAPARADHEDGRGSGHIDVRINSITFPAPALDQGSIGQAVALFVIEQCGDSDLRAPF
jgi:hypothetical protein